MRLRVTFAVCILAILGCDVVTDQYDSIAAARNGRLFERGWLPDILPASSKAIRVSNNLDINISEGEFTFVSSDFTSFREALSSNAPAATPFKDWATFFDGKAREGYVPLTFSQDKTTWVFLCHETRGHCVYRMWQATSAG